MKDSIVLFASTTSIQIRNKLVDMRSPEFRFENIFLLGTNPDH